MLEVELPDVADTSPLTGAAGLEFRASCAAAAPVVPPGGPPAPGGILDVGGTEGASAALQVPVI